MEFRVTVTIAEHGRDPDNGLAFLRGFRTVPAAMGPVVDQDTETGHLSVTFCFEASGLEEAMNTWVSIFTEGGAASGLSPTPLMDFGIAAEVERVAGDSEPARGSRKRELQPA